MDIEDLLDINNWEDNEDITIVSFEYNDVVYDIITTYYNTQYPFTEAYGNLYSTILEGSTYKRELVASDKKVSDLLGRAYIDYKTNYE